MHACIFTHGSKKGSPVRSWFFKISCLFLWSRPRFFQNRFSPNTDPLIARPGVEKRATGPRGNFWSHRPFPLGAGACFFKIWFCKNRLFAKPARGRTKSHRPKGYFFESPAFCLKSQYRFFQIRYIKKAVFRSSGQWMEKTPCRLKAFFAEPWPNIKGCMPKK